MRAKDVPIKIYIGTEQRDLAKELGIDQADLYGELMDQPTWYAYYATLMVEAGASLDAANGEFANLQAEVANTIRADAARGGLKITEKRIDLETITNSRVQAKSRQVQEKKKQYDILKVVVKSFEQRLQSLISLCTLERIQFKGEERTANSQQKAPYGSSSPSKGPVCATPRSEMLEALRQMKKGGS